VALWFNHGVIGVILQRFWCLFVICELKEFFLRRYKLIFVGVFSELFLCFLEIKKVFIFKSFFGGIFVVAS
jgi:hypothetical protein